MNTIKIEFTHPKLEQPSFSFGDRVAIKENCAPEAWATGEVIGLILETDFPVMWIYVVKLDSPSGLVEELPGFDLVPEDAIPTLQSDWLSGGVAGIQSDPEVIEDCDRCEGKGYVIDGWTFQSDICSHCAGTGIKGYAKRLPPASLREERAEF